MRSLPAPMDFKPVPQAKDSLWRQMLPQRLRNDYIAAAKKHLGKTWDPIPNSVFGEFKKNGNRTNYEQKNFALRQRLAVLVMAEILEHKGNFINDIDQGLRYTLSEVWWGIPAHYPTATPDAQNQVVDLFNAETANLLAWTAYMLHDELENTDRGICETIRKEINRRILVPARTNDYTWKKRSWNHNTWTCANWLSCILFCEKDRKKQRDAIQQVLRCLDIFVAGYPNDGGCDEGIGYWNRATGSLFDCIQLLSLATKDAVRYPQTEKLLAMATFPYKLYIGNNQYVNFADSRPSATIPYEVLFPLGLSIKDSALTQFAVLNAQRSSFHFKPALHYRTSEFPSLSRELMFLIHYNIFKDTRTAEPLVRDTWLPYLQVFTARSEENSTHNFYVAAKGGHNDESHNHNDVGNFIVYNDAEPVLIDIGVGTYTSQTFSGGRYNLFNCRSAYHNVPLINGIEQQAGKNFRAKNVKYYCDERQASLTLDIADAYPQEASVKQWRRTILLNRSQEIRITEDYQLLSYQKPTELILITCGTPLITGDGVITISTDKQTYLLRYNTALLTPAIEEIQYNDTKISNTWNKKTLYRILLTIKKRSLKGKISYSLSKAKAA
ncbi:MAG: heparinase II/III family protein [Prevotella sp.]|nr:heparinase II/III family protein [Prevotella sp.]